MYKNMLKILATGGVGGGGRFDQHSGFTALQFIGNGTSRIAYISRQLTFLVISRHSFVKH